MNAQESRSAAVRRSPWTYPLVLALLWGAISACAAAQEATESTQVPEAEISQAERNFRLGVSLYGAGNFREALDEFNRALALDPDNAEYLEFRRRCEEKLAIGAAGIDPTATPSFETFDPEAIETQSPESAPQLNPEEHKIRTVRELVKLGEKYLEFQFYEEAVDHFEQVLLIAPDNTRAQDGLHKATIGLLQEGVEKSQGQLEEQTEEIRRFIEQQKLLPEGADPTGIKNPRINIPTIEERFEEPVVRSEIDEILDTTVSITFEDIHIQDILDFVSETYDVNVIIDNRVVEPPELAAPATGIPGQPGAFPAPPPVRPGGGGGGGGGLGAGLADLGPVGGVGAVGATATAAGVVTDGMVPYVNVRNVKLREALRVLLRPLNLDFSVQPSFIWISTPEVIRQESFEDLETRYYELRNAGAETLFKLVLANPGGLAGGQGGGGQFGGGGGGGQQFGGGGGGQQFGGGGGGGQQFGGGGGGQQFGGGGGGGQQFGGGGGGQFGGQGGGGGQFGGQGGGGFGGVQVQNISQLFQTPFNDLRVGEFPNPISSGAGQGGGGAGNAGAGAGQAGGGAGGFGGGGGGGGAAAAGQFNQQGLGATAGVAGEPQIMTILRNIIPQIIEPVSGRILSFMWYNIVTNQLIVHNTPTNLGYLERQLEHLDLTPKQVSIEAKFLTVSIQDLEKEGFQWNITSTDLNNRDRVIGDLGETTYSYDVNGDGVAEQVPFYTQPDGSQVVNNSITSLMLDALASPGPDGAFNLEGVLLDNGDGDRISVVFDFLNSLEESELLSAPRVTTMNQKPAVIADIRTEFFITSIFNNVQVTDAGFGGQPTTVVSQTKTPQAFTFGITLSVTPQIAGDDQVRLWLNPQVTTLIGQTTIPQTLIFEGETITDFLILPETSIQSVWTNVIVNDGDTLVLGGLVTDNTIKGEEKFPYLADIPVLGYFFRGKSSEVRQASLLIFVTPDIIDTTGARYFESEGSGGTPR